MPLTLLGLGKAIVSTPIGLLCLGLTMQDGHPYTSASNSEVRGSSPAGARSPGHR